LTMSSQGEKRVRGCARRCPLCGRPIAEPLAGVFVVGEGYDWTGVPLRREKPPTSGITTGGKK